MPRSPDQGKPLILMIDDEGPILKSMSLLLRAEGFEMIVARDGSEAIHAFAERARDIAAVTLDMVMPTTSGGETLAMLSAYAADLPIVIATAMPQPDIVFGRAPGTRGVGYIQKPFTARQLAQEIRRVIAEMAPLG